ncbi:aromatic compound dioxygenase [Neolentinus lepideus HHB14362 ss-1]|uniref:Aromatic compound dioxygenase n=1 Tax=Neolentinus lepideus HHB14362 ss-1 TaxID=1314782 RepID=A0A165RD44_9AGAM|nr:aromatic compound dioxygenase [Neolentinus lepideus HHB14362 ss-1]
MADQKKPQQGRAVSNGIPPPNLDLPYPDRPELITQNLLKLTELCPDERKKYIFKNLITHIHHFINETSITTEEWMSTIQFLTRIGQTCTPLRQEFILLSDVLGISALVDALNNPPVSGGTESSVLGPFFTEDAPDVNNGDSIASEGKGEYMYVEGQVIDTHGKPVPNALIETWETDEFGFYDTQYPGREKPDCRGRLRTDKDGKYGYRAVVPVAYPIPGDGPVGELLLMLNRHNMRPNHLHLMIEAPGYQTLTTALYPKGDDWLASDAVFGVKKSLVVSLKDVDNEQQARQCGFPHGSHFKLLKHDIVLVPVAESKAAREQYAREHAVEMK